MESYWNVASLLLVRNTEGQWIIFRRRRKPKSLKHVNKSHLLDFDVVLDVLQVAPAVRRSTRSLRRSPPGGVACRPSTTRRAATRTSTRRRSRPATHRRFSSSRASSPETCSRRAACQLNPDLRPCFRKKRRFCQSPSGAVDTEPSHALLPSGYWRLKLKSCRLG